MNMNWLDILLLCLAGIGFVKGLFDGVVKQVVSIIALVVGIFFCGKAAMILKDYVIASGWFSPGSITMVSYILAFLLIILIITFAGRILHHLIGVTPLSVFNHLAGGVFGLVMVMLLSSLLFNVLEAVDPGSSLISVETKIESRYYYRLTEILPKIYSMEFFHPTGTTVV